MHLGQVDSSQTLSDEQKSYIEQFKDKAAQFWRAWNDLVNKQDDVKAMPADIQKEYATLVDQGNVIKNTIAEVTAMIDRAASAYQSVKDWISSTFGLSGLAADNKAKQLGFIPLIAIAVVVGGITAITGWITHYVAFNNRWDKIQTLMREQDMTPQQAAAVVDAGGNGGGIMQGIGQAIPFALVGVGALLLLLRGGR
jgi:hypothetical protein